MVGRGWLNGAVFGPGVANLLPKRRVTARRDYSSVCYSRAMTEKSDVLREVMRETGPTQSELSRLSGVRQPSIRKFRCGRVERSDDSCGRWRAGGGRGRAPSGGGRGDNGLVRCRVVRPLGA